MVGCYDVQAISTFICYHDKNGGAPILPLNDRSLTQPLAVTCDRRTASQCGALNLRLYEGAFVLISIVLIVVNEIVSTHQLLSHTFHEPIHIVADMEWIQYHTYQVEPLLPPLARLSVAMGPFFDGRHLPNWQLTCLSGGRGLMARRSSQISLQEDF